MQRRQVLLGGAALAAPALPLRAAAARSAPALQPFALADVRLLGGAFQRAQALDARYLRSLDADRLLQGFRVNAGLAPKAPRYGGWESMELCPGHTLGHYLSACSMMWASTGQADFRRRVAYVVGELHDCQQASGSGLVCAFPDGDAPVRNALAGRPAAGVPWYTMHKILAGLRDAHVHAGDPRALPVLTRLADWIVEASQATSDERFQQMLGVEHGGMNEVLADLHALTGDARYLQLARRFNHRALLDPLAEGRDTLDGLHSNTQIPKVIGFARLAAATGDERYAKAARYFWGNVVHRRSFATGGNGDGEHFFPPAETVKHLDSAKTMETCCTARCSPPSPRPPTPTTTSVRSSTASSPRRIRTRAWSPTSSPRAPLIRSCTAHPNARSGAAPAPAWKTSPSWATRSTSTTRTRCTSTSSSPPRSTGPTSASTCARRPASPRSRARGWRSTPAGPPASRCACATPPGAHSSRCG
jgi:hypothetical protein